MPVSVGRCGHLSAPHLSVKAVLVEQKNVGQKNRLPSGAFRVLGGNFGTDNLPAESKNT
jgi:hypothetical protein